MNRQIRKLAENTDRDCEHLGCSDIGEEWLEKFAESIVRECMRLNRDILCEDDPDYLDKIYRDHFGIK